MTIMIKKDKSYLSTTDKLAIENGIAELGVYSLRIDRYYTEEQKESNRKVAESLSSEEWSIHCKEIKQRISDKIEKVMDQINNKFVVYQYKNKDIDYSNDKWDLFFWCNDGDMSYIRLNPNKKLSNKQQLETINKTIDLIKSMVEIDGISVTIQYTTIYNEEKVNNIKGKVFNQFKNEWVVYAGMEGRIKIFGKEYGFMKKRVRKTYYTLPDSWFIEMAFPNSEIA